MSLRSFPKSTWSNPPLLVSEVVSQSFPGLLPDVCPASLTRPACWSCQQGLSSDKKAGHGIQDPYGAEVTMLWLVLEEMVEADPECPPETACSGMPPLPH